MRHLYLAVAALLLLAFGWFGWPTPYEHYRSGRTPIRVHRLTGKVERLTLNGWQVVPPVAGSATSTAP